MPSRKAPEPDYVVLCSDTFEWQADADAIAAFGYSMLLHGAAPADLDFARRLARKHHLQCSINLETQEYFLWKPAVPAQMQQG